MNLSHSLYPTSYWQFGDCIISTLLLKFIKYTTKENDIFDLLFTNDTILPYNFLFDTNTRIWCISLYQ